jgi:hypothetical protein
MPKKRPRTRRHARTLAEDSRGERIREPFTETREKLLGARGGNGGRGSRGCLLVKVERIFLSGEENVGQQL